MTIRKHTRRLRTWLLLMGLGLLLAGITHLFAEEQAPTPRPETQTGTTESLPDIDNEGWIVDDYPAALAIARKEGKPIFVDFAGYTCTNSRWMEKNMFDRPEVAELLGRYVRVRLYLDGRKEINRTNQQMQRERFHTIAMPFYAIVSPDDSVATTFPGMTRRSEYFMQFLEKGLASGGKR
jgi:thiol:disulfide interchange protein